MQSRWDKRRCSQELRGVKWAAAANVGKKWRLTFTSRVHVHRGLPRRAAEHQQHVGGEKRPRLRSHALAAILRVKR